MHHRPVVRLAALLAAFALIGPPSTDAQPRHLSGRVVDESGAAIPGARISIAPASRTVTDADGQFDVRAPDAPAVTLRVEKPRFRTREVTIVDEAGPLRIVLDIAPVVEQISVASPIVDATTFDPFGSTQTIVSAAQIESLNAVDLASALRRTPGVTISRFNPVGSFGGAEGGSVHVRGIGASRPGSEIMTYVDGAPFYMGLWGHPLLDLLPVSGVQDVRVLKGPQPQQFGNAFSAIDLTSKRAQGESVQGTARLAGGSFGTVVEQADVTGRAGAWDFAAAQGFARSDGHRDDAEGRLANVSARVGYRWARAWTLAGSILHVDNTASDPGVEGRPETKAGRYDTSGTLATLSLSHDLARARGVVQVHGSRGDGNWFDQLPPDGDTLNRFTIAGVRWREEVAPWSGGLLTGGLTFERTDGDASFQRDLPATPGAFAGAPMSLVAPHVALAHTWALPGGWSLSPSAGIRGYGHSEFASEMAPHAGLVLRGARPVTLRTTYARGVRYPGPEVVVLSSLIPPLRDSWRQLGAETVDHGEAGVTVAPTPWTSIDASFFVDRYAHRYVFAFPPVAIPPAFLNLGQHTTRGAEIAVQQRLATRWEVFGGLTLLDATRDRLPYAPRTTVVLGITGAAGPVRLAVDAQAQAAMYVFGRGRTPVAPDLAEIDGFTVVNVRPSYRLPAFDGTAELFAAIENVFDARYAYRPGYPMPGTSIQVGVTIAAGSR